MRIRNLTPHAISFYNQEGTEVLMVVEPDGELARVSARTVATGDDVCGIPVTMTSYSEVTGIPAEGEEPDTIYIVSSLVASRCSGRRDVFIPNESIRDDKGRIIGCKSLGRV